MATGAPCSRSTAADFAHISPVGVTRIIETPDVIRDLRPAATVVVKLNGGVIDDAPLEESFVVEIGQFERLAAQLPDRLPICVRTELTRRRLLFLGHGLNEPDVRAIIKFAKPPKWTVQQPPGDSTQIRDLTEFGLMPIVRDLDEFTAQLHH